MTDGPRHVTTGDVVGPVDATKRLGFVTVPCVDVEFQSRCAAVDRMRERVGAVPIQVSVDIDVLDPAHAPGTGTPEAAGLTSREIAYELLSIMSCKPRSPDVR